jgi:hypothetical protein
VRTLGSLVDRLTTFGSLEVNINPGTGRTPGVHFKNASVPFSPIQLTLGQPCVCPVFSPPAFASVSVTTGLALPVGRTSRRRCVRGLLHRPGIRLPLD